MPAENLWDNASPGQTDPGRLSEKVQSGVEFQYVSRALLVGVGGTATLVDENNASFPNVLLPAGVVPIKGIKSITLGTASEIWVLV